MNNKLYSSQLTNNFNKTIIIKLLFSIMPNLEKLNLVFKEDKYVWPINGSIIYVYVYVYVYMYM